jgi:hypothetical protein
MKSVPAEGAGRRSGSSSGSAGAHAPTTGFASVLRCQRHTARSALCSSRMPAMEGGRCKSARGRLTRQMPKAHGTPPCAVPAKTALPGKRPPGLAAPPRRCQPGSCRTARCSATTSAAAAAGATAVAAGAPAQPTVAKRRLAEGGPAGLAGRAEASVLQRDEWLAAGGGLVGGQLEEGGVGAEIGGRRSVDEGIHLRRRQAAAGSGGMMGSRDPLRFPAARLPPLLGRRALCCGHATPAPPHTATHKPLDVAAVANGRVHRPAVVPRVVEPAAAPQAAQQRRQTRWGWRRGCRHRGRPGWLAEQPPRQSGCRAALMQESPRSLTRGWCARMRAHGR